MVSVCHRWVQGLCDLPSGVSPEADIVLLSLPKLSYTPPQPEILIVRNGFHFNHYELPKKKSNGEEIKERKSKTVQFVKSKLSEGIRLSKTNLVEAYLSELNMTRSQARTTVEQLIAEHKLEHTPLPKDECQGSRTTYLTPPESDDDSEEWPEIEVPEDDF